MVPVTAHPASIYDHPIRSFRTRLDSGNQVMS
jgi:hypothetical protein